MKKPSLLFVAGGHEKTPPAVSARDEEIVFSAVPLLLKQTASALDI
jgi:hypothetical protein